MLWKYADIDPLEDSLPDLPVQGFTLTCLHLCRQKLFQVAPTSVNLLHTSEATTLCNPHRLAPFAFGMDNGPHLNPSRRDARVLWIKLGPLGL